MFAKSMKKRSKNVLNYEKLKLFPENSELLVKYKPLQGWLSIEICHPNLRFYGTMDGLLAEKRSACHNRARNRNAQRLSNELICLESK